MTDMQTGGTRVLAQPPAAIRNGIRDVLTATPAFDGLDADDRRTIAHALVRIAHAAKVLEQEAAPASVPVARAMTAGEEFSGAAVDRMAGTTRRMLNAVSFPRFVNELITGVFRAIVQTNQQQLQQYVELVRGVSQSLDGFSSLAGNDDMARRWLADQFPQSFQIEQPDAEEPPAPDDEPEPLRLISSGTPPTAAALRAALSLEADAEVPSGGGEALVKFVRSALARNRQQMLGTMVQMGMQRIVIDSGRINAAMRFHIDASSAAEEARSSSFDTRTTIGASASGGFGLWSASASVSSTIGYVSTSDARTREELNASADLNSSVELHFRTDQVPLDRIASQQTVDRLRLNTLNPERELDIARQADDARLGARVQAETARAARPRPAVAPAAGTPPPAPAPDPARGGRGGSSGSPSSAGGATPATPTDGTPATPAAPPAAAAPATAATPPAAAAPAPATARP